VSHVLDAELLFTYGTLIASSQPLAVKTQRQMPKTVLKRV
jgi:hypothetical protein